MKMMFGALALVSLSAAAPAATLTVRKTVEIAASPQLVWQTIGTFCGIGDWHPVIEKCVLAGDKPNLRRVLSLRGGGTIVEKEVSRNDRKMTYTYSILSGPLPVSHYRSSITVVKKGTGSEVIWSGNFDAAGMPDDKAREAIEGVYATGLQGLSAKVGTAR